MNPEAFQIGPLTIRWYGIFVALGFFCGYLFALRRARNKGISPDAMGDLLFWTMVAAVIGARALYVIQFWSEFAAKPADIIRIDKGGLVFYGGLLGAVSAVILICRIKRLPLFTVGDVMAPVVPLGQAIGRIGCLLNGCCFGHPYSGLCRMHYPDDSAVAYVQHVQGLLTNGQSTVLPVFPIQLIYSLVNLVIVAVLLLIERRLRIGGRLFGIFMIFYGTARFALEFGRGDYLGSTAGMTPAQVLCLIVVPTGLWLVWLGGRHVAAERSSMTDE